MNKRSSAILTYHSLDASGSVISTYPEVFKKQMAFLFESAIPVVPLSAVGKVPGSVALTFDDGFKNFLHSGLPVLEQYRLPATIFVVSGYCGRWNNWPSQAVDLVPRLELMSWSDLREVVRENITLGAHTVNHPRLTDLPERQIAGELHDCRSEVENQTGQAADAFAYPYGAVNSMVRDRASREFRFACGTSLRFLTRHADPFDLPRIDAYYLRGFIRPDNVMSTGGLGYIAIRRLMRGFRECLFR